MEKHHTSLITTTDFSCSGHSGGQAGRCRRAEDRGDGAEAVRRQAGRGIQRRQQAKAIGRHGHDRGPSGKRPNSSMTSVLYSLRNQNIMPACTVVQLYGMLFDLIFCRPCLVRG